jgi:hypothetical protein
MATAALGALSPPMLSPFAVFAGGIPVLIGLQRGPRWTLIAAAAGALTAMLVMNQVGQSFAINFANAAVLFVAPALLAVLLGATGSLNLTFQVAVLGTAVGLIGVYALVDDPVGMWIPMIRSVLDSLTQAGFQMREDPETVTAALAKIMWGAFAALTLCTVLNALWLGRWWQSLLVEQGSFGREFQQLRMGLVLGLGTSLVLLLALWSESGLVGSLVWVAFAALSLQGLAAAHRSRARGSLNRGWLAAIYVLLVVPLSTVITIVALAVWGFADNWTRARPQNV